MDELGTETALEGALFDVVVRRYRRAGGSEYERQVVVHPGAVAILAHDEEWVFLVRQPREAVGEEGLLEIPAGTLDVEGESRLQCARRELAEEAGLVAERWEEVRSFYPIPGFGDLRTTVFLATELRAVAPRPDEGEEIAIVRWPLADLDRAIEAVQDAKTLIALLILRQRLRDAGAPAASSAG